MEPPNNPLVTFLYGRVAEVLGNARILLVPMRKGLEIELESVDSLHVVRAGQAYCRTPATSEP